MPSGRPVVLLHSSAGSSRQWERLRAALEGSHRVITVDLHGYGQTPMPALTDGFGLEDEVTLVEEALEQAGEPAHLVGHSYGGAVAAKTALMFPARVRSLFLHEPVLFHLLRLEGRREEWAEIRDRCAAVSKLVAEGRVSEGLEAFVDYWNGAGAYRSLAEPRRRDLDRTAPKLVLDFQALFEEKTPLAEFAGIQAPLSLSVGERTRPPARAVAELLAGARGDQAPWVIDQAGHMAPITHAAQVNRLIVERLSPSR